MASDSVQLLLSAYRQGCFPMAEDPGKPLAWFCPDPRGIIPLSPSDGLHIPRRLTSRLRARPFLITCDTAFEAVIRGCALPRPSEPDTWIDARIVALYTAAHRVGHAHSIEAWAIPPDPSIPDPLAPWTPAPPIPGAALVGGIYGLHIGAAFFAESKFSRPALGGTDASKICLVHLIAHLRRRGVELLDTQFWNPHIAQFGCTEIPRRDYLARLERATARDIPWPPFTPDAPLFDEQSEPGHG